MKKLMIILAVVDFNVPLQKGSSFNELRCREFRHVIHMFRYDYFPLENKSFTGRFGYYKVYDHHHFKPCIFVHYYYDGQGNNVQ